MALIGVGGCGLVLWWATSAASPEPGPAPAPLVLSTAPAALRATTIGPVPATSPTVGASAAEPTAAPTAPTPQPSRPAPSTPAPSSWADVLAALDDRRSTAFATGTALLLDDVYAAGSPPLARDAAALADLTGRGLRAVGLRLQVATVSVVSSTSEAATLQVVDQLAPYRLVDRAGVVVATEPGRGQVTWTLTVTSAAGGWRISDVARV